VGWPPPADKDDAALEALLYPRPKPGVEVHPTPDFEWIERELRRKHVTRRQLWREYLARYPDGLKYTAFCVKFQQWRRRRGVTMSRLICPAIDCSWIMRAIRPSTQTRRRGSRKRLGSLSLSGPTAACSTPKRRVRRPPLTGLAPMYERWRPLAWRQRPSCPTTVRRQ
jgi:hypothetical protein